MGPGFIFLPVLNLASVEQLLAYTCGRADHEAVGFHEVEQLQPKSGFFPLRYVSSCGAVLLCNTWLEYMGHHNLKLKIIFSNSY